MKITIEIEIDKISGGNKSQGILDMLDNYQSKKVLDKKKDDLKNKISSEFETMVKGLVYNNLNDMGIYMFGDCIRLPETPSITTHPTILTVVLPTKNGWKIDDDLNVVTFPKIVLTPTNGWERLVEFEDFSEEFLLDVIKESIDIRKEYKEILINHLKK